MAPAVQVGHADLAGLVVQVGQAVQVVQVGQEVGGATMSRRALCAWRRRMLQAWATARALRCSRLVAVATAAMSLGMPTWTICWRIKARVWA